MELTAQQVAILGVVVSAFAWLLRLVASKLGYVPGKEVMTVVVYVVSIAFAVLFAGASLPEPTAGAWIDFLTINLGPFAAFAFMIYNFIMSRLADAVGEKLPILAVS